MMRSLPSSGFRKPRPSTSTQRRAMHICIGHLNALGDVKYVYRGAAILCSTLGRCGLRPAQAVWGSECGRERAHMMACLVVERLPQGWMTKEGPKSLESISSTFARRSGGLRASAGWSATDEQNLYLTLQVEPHHGGERPRGGPGGLYPVLLDWWVGIRVGWTEVEMPTF
jgi:hypothetical protein